MRPFALIMFSSLALSCAKAPAATSDKASSSPRVEVVVQAIETADIKASVELPGQLEPMAQSELRPQVRGQLAELYVDLGDRITKGDVLASVAVPDHEDRLQLSGAEADEAAAVVKARSGALKLTRLQTNRIRKVAKSGRGLVSQQKLDEANTALALAQARLSEARAHLNTARKRQQLNQTLVDFANIRAPFDGIVVKRMADVGTLVGPDTAVFTVASIARVRAVAYVPATDAVLIDDTARANLSFPGSGIAPIQTPLARVGGAVNPMTQEVRVEAHIDLPAGLPASSYVRFNLTLKSRTNVRVVPGKALHVAGKPHHLYIYRNGICHLVAVKTGADDGNKVEILSGVKPGDKVVVSTKGTLKKQSVCTPID